MVKVSNKIRKYYKNPRGVLVLIFSVKAIVNIFVIAILIITYYCASTLLSVPL